MEKDFRERLGKSSEAQRYQVRFCTGSGHHIDFSENVPEEERSISVRDIEPYMRSGKIKNITSIASVGIPVRYSGQHGLQALVVIYDPLKSSKEKKENQSVFSASPEALLRSTFSEKIKLSIQKDKGACKFVGTLKKPDNALKGRFHVKHCFVIKEFSVRIRFDNDSCKRSYPHIVDVGWISIQFLRDQIWMHHKWAYHLLLGESIKPSKKLDGKRVLSGVKKGQVGELQEWIPRMS